MNLMQSAISEAPWSAALRIGLTKHGDTPIHDHLAAEFAAAAKKPARKKPRRPSGGGNGGAA